MNNIFIIIQTAWYTSKWPTNYKQNTTSEKLTITYFIFYIRDYIFIAIFALSLFRLSSSYYIKVILIVSISSLIDNINNLDLFSIIFLWWWFLIPLLLMTILHSITLLLFVRLLHHYLRLLHHHLRLLHHHHWLLLLLHHHYWLFVHYHRRLMH